ncbi:hypothetical protein GCM10022217_19170 [Chryseobacterium ginsenosidimutans]
MLTALVLSLLSCRPEDVSETLSNQTHKSNFDASFKEVLKATKSPDENSLMAKVPDFAEGYEPSDFLIDTTKIKKTVKNGEITEYAIYLKKKNETEVGVFYNLVFTKKINHWKKYLVKFTPSIIPETNAKVGYRCEFISKKAQASKCGSSFYMTEYFQCWAGHTDPNDGDCNGCWRLGTYGITNTCDEEAPDDFNGAGDNYGGGVIPNIDGVINAYADPYHWGLYNGLSVENKFKCYQALMLSSDTSYVNFSISFFYNNPTTSWEQFQNWFLNQNSLSLVSTVSGSNSIIFNNLQDFKSSLLSKNSNLITESLILQDNGSEKIVSARVKRTGVWGSGEEVRIKLKKVNNVWTFDSVISTEYGLTLGVWSFTQLDYSQNTNSNTLTVEVTGLENYNVFLEGLGTVYKDRVMIRVKININTGNIFSIEFIDL